MVEEKTEQTNQEPTKEVETPKQEPVPEIQVVQVPTEFGLAFKTPVGELDANTYLAWLGNMVLDLKKGMIGA